MSTASKVHQQILITTDIMSSQIFWNNSRHGGDKLLRSLIFRSIEMRFRNNSFKPIQVLYGEPILKNELDKVSWFGSAGNSKIMARANFASTHRKTITCDGNITNLKIQLAIVLYHYDSSILSHYQ
jgi:hypothetical protein